MDLQKIVNAISLNRKPLAAVCLVVGFAIIITTSLSTVGMIFVLLGLIGMFWENIVRRE